MAADAVSQELPNLLETIQRGGTGSVPRTSQEREAIPQRNVAEEWTEAVVLAQAASDPGGASEFHRAQLAALLGPREQAVEFLRDGFARGLSMGTSVHRQMDFETLRGFAPFDELMRPKG